MIEKIKIVSNGIPRDTKVYFVRGDLEIDITGAWSSITWHIDTGSLGSVEMVAPFAQLEALGVLTSLKDMVWGEVE